MSQKRLLLGITGGIAAYKTVELVRRLRQHHYDVSQSDIGFDHSDNALTVLSSTKVYSLPKAPKAQIAQQLLTIIAEQFH